jgi:hypothetical protein
MKMLLIPYLEVREKRPVHPFPDTVPEDVGLFSPDD